MDTKRTTSFLVIASLAVALMTMGTISDIDALKAKNQDQLSPKSFGSRTDVCGDKLCSEVEEQRDKEHSQVKVIDVYPLSGDFFKLLLKVYGEQVDPKFENVIYVTSDAANRVISVPFIQENSYDYVTTTIKAFDAESIEVVYSPTKAVQEIDAKTPKATLIDASNISDQENIYRVIVDVTTTDFNAKNIKISVSSDLDKVTYTIGGLIEDNTHTNQIIMQVSDPRSVSVQVVDFEINR